MPTIFLTHIPDMLKNYYGERALAELRKLGDVRLNDTGQVLDAKALAQAAQGCEIIISDRQTAGPAEFFPLVGDLVAFLRVAVDIRNVDVAAASAQGILVTHATPGFIASVAEMAIGFMIDCGRHVTEATSVYRTGRVPEARMGRQLKGATLGIIGYGAIGEHLAELGLALGMTVLVADPHKGVTRPMLKQVQFADLLARSDFVVCLAIANEQTENLMNAEAFAQMMPSAYFINLSRGNLVDEAALARALDDKRISGAALDVGRAQDQMPSLALARRADVIATPHTAGLTPEAAEHQAFDTVNQVKDLIAGRMPPGAANPEAARRLSTASRVVVSRLLNGKASLSTRYARVAIARLISQLSVVLLGQQLRHDSRRLIVLRVAGGEGGGYTGDLTGGFPENRENNRNIKGKGGVMTPPSRKLTR